MARVILFMTDVACARTTYQADPTSGELLTTHTIFTGEPNELVRPIHNRMPVILDQAD